ncbi:hypothetical protein HSRCO_1250 [Halanaeroarchaeum sp. HSR-CO]|uniref:hypothetical protein n=1 Tax=Halanaeroarchaeum sp. HSR-CO TaxID=2866382 RepID=UPI00217E8BF4|nr:hypothetical protein [Halanaeroarchaeum sp. HSR-CO]UWG47534.1 hypothetical protein HSRCO_1250 [Halanaeroarchaeum sp. HSR-CO]
MSASDDIETAVEGLRDGFDDAVTVADELSDTARGTVEETIDDRESRIEDRRSGLPTTSSHPDERLTQGVTYSFVCDTLA